VTAGVVTQFCQPPVSVTGTVANGVAVRESSRNWIWPPVADWVSGEAMRTVTEAVPLPKLTPEYSGQLLLLIQPTSWPPPVSLVFSRPVLFAAVYCEGGDRHRPAAAPAAPAAEPPQPHRSTQSRRPLQSLF
jgi:hypothetical protein